MQHEKPTIHDNVFSFFKLRFSFFKVNDVILHYHLLSFLKYISFLKFNEIYLSAQINPTYFIQIWKAMKKLQLL